MKSRLATLAGLVGVLVMASSSRAALLAADGFDDGNSQPNGTALSSTTTDNTGTVGWATSTWSGQFGGAVTSTSGFGNYDSTGLTSNTVPYSGGSAQVIASAGASAVVYRQLHSVVDASATNGSTVFVSFLMQWSGVNRTSGITILDSSGTLVADVGFTTGNTHWALDAYGLGGTTSVQGTNANSVATTSPTLMVAELDYNGGSGHDTVELYVNPATSYPGKANADVTIGGGSGSDPNFTLPGVDGIRLFSGFATGNTNLFDEVRIGDTFNDVVPEPTCAVILLPAALMLISRRRRPNQKAPL